MSKTLKTIAEARKKIALGNLNFVDILKTYDQIEAEVKETCCNKQCKCKE
jgi:hypothetical protein